MITDVGKNILAKYLVGQAQAYASFIAIGIGPRPLAVGETFPDFSTQEQLEFEADRMPITSRGFVYNENGEPNIVFLAEITSRQRFAITEIGIYPGRSNPSAENKDSRILFNFLETENWEYHTQNTASAINTFVGPLNLDQASSKIAVPDDVFRTNSNNTLFSSPIRRALFEGPRFLNKTMMLRGDTSSLIVQDGKLSVEQEEGSYFGSHIHNNGISIDLDRSSTEDELRLALSVLSKDDTDTNATVQSVRLLIEFSNADVDTPTTFARFELILNQSDTGINFSTNRYFVIKKKISDLIKSPNFTWAAVNSVRIYATVIETGLATPSSNFYVSLDGLRFENTTTKSPLYGLTGYSLVKTPDGRPVIKEVAEGSSNSIEFRFGLDVA